MSNTALNDVLNRWFRDRQFREQLRSDPEQALAPYDLSPEQRAKFLKLKKPRPGKKQEAMPARSANSDFPFSLN